MRSVRQRGGFGQVYPFNVDTGRDETPAAELWKKTLSQIPSIFGRLFYLASLREMNTGFYLHFGFAQRFSEREADKTIRRSHQITFEDWLCFSLEQQQEDIELYLANLDQDRNAVLANWKAFPPFTNFAPILTKEAQRDLFLADLQLILELIR